jgi:hypothetical protein
MSVFYFKPCAYTVRYEILCHVPYEKLRLYRPLTYGTRFCGVTKKRNTWNYIFFSDIFITSSWTQINLRDTTFTHGRQ